MNPQPPPVHRSPISPSCLFAVQFVCSLLLCLLSIVLAEKYGNSSLKLRRLTDGQPLGGDVDSGIYVRTIPPDWVIDLKAPVSSIPFSSEGDGDGRNSGILLRPVPSGSAGHIGAGGKLGPNQVDTPHLLLRPATSPAGNRRGYHPSSRPPASRLLPSVRPPTHRGRPPGGGPLLPGVPEGIGHLSEIADGASCIQYVSFLAARRTSQGIVVSSPSRTSREGKVGTLLKAVRRGSGPFPRPEVPTAQPSHSRTLEG